MTTTEKQNADQTVYHFRGVSKPVKTWGKQRGQSVNGDCYGYKRIEWVEYSNGNCEEIFIVELCNGEKFGINESDWRIAQAASPTMARIKGFSHNA